MFEYRNLDRYSRLEEALLAEAGTVPAEGGTVLAEGETVLAEGGTVNGVGIDLYWQGRNCWNVYTGLCDELYWQGSSRDWWRNFLSLRVYRGPNCQPHCGNPCLLAWLPPFFAPNVHKLSKVSIQDTRRLKVIFAAVEILRRNTRAFTNAGILCLYNEVTVFAPRKSKIIMQYISVHTVIQ